MKAMGYEPTMDGMDDQDVKDALEAMDRRNAARQQGEWQYPRYKQPDSGFVARIMRMFGQPYDKSAIDPKEANYLNGWDNGDDDDDGYDDAPQAKPAQNLFQPSRGGGRQADGQWKLNWGGSGNMFGAGMQPMNAKISGTNWWVDPKGMFPQYGGGAECQPPGEPTGTAPAAPKSPQSLWDEHIWNSLDVISAQTPKEKRAAVNKILNERRGEFDAAYQAAHGDKAAERWENDKKFTLNAMGDYVTADQLKAFGWQNVDDKTVKDLNDALMKYEITTPARLRHFLSQSARETNKGEYYTEQNYGDKTYFKRMYEGRKDLGNIYPGDGEKFIGTGGIHLTGRKDFQNFADYIGDQDVMKGGAEYVAKKYPWLAAGWWWEKNHMNKEIDSLKGEDHDADADKVTDVVNYWDNPGGRQQRKDYHREIRGIITD